MNPPSIEPAEPVASTVPTRRELIWQRRALAIVVAVVVNVIILGIFTHGGFSYEGEDEQAAISPLEGILRGGQDAGVFRAFDVRVMATTIQRAIDGIPMALAADPSLDLDVYARELVELFTLATQARRE